MKLPQSVRAVTEHFERLPGIGPKTAQRLALYLLHVPDHVLAEFATDLTSLKPGTRFCSQCHLIGESETCAICADEARDRSIICVVEQPLDVIALEQAGKYAGLYHVLHGVISPLDNIGPDELFLRDLLARLDGVNEVILATNSTMEGEGTALYIERLIRDDGHDESEVKITRIGHGLPIGANIEFADGITLARALEGRRSM